MRPRAARRRSVPAVAAGIAAGIAAVVTLAGPLVACSRAAPAPAALPSPPAVPTPSATMSTPSAGPSRPARPARPPYQWLSGLPWHGDRPVLAVKIDNVGAGRPHVGVGEADVVYVEEVEEGLTRLMAVYSSRLPALVGPVRSARTNDLELLRAYGRPVLAFSGANAGLSAQVARSRVVDASATVLGAYFFRDRARAIPHNMMLRPPALVRDHPGTQARDVGFRFGRARQGGAQGRVVSVRYPHASYGWVYDPPSRRYGLSLDGRRDRYADGLPVAAANVILQFVDVHPDRYADVNGNVSPYSVTTGRGGGIVLRGGVAVPVTWRRPLVDGPTRFLAADGKDVALAAGQTWVLLVPRATPLSVR